MFSTKEFIAASRAFVCVRLETFESKEHQDMVRELLNGRFVNTAFCILAPDGKKRLSRAGRSPAMGFGIRQSEDPDPEEVKKVNARVIEAMNGVAKKYPAQGNAADAVMVDFHSFEQALNVSSGDQRLLVFAVTAEEQNGELKKNMQKVANRPDVMGRYHFDFSASTDTKWSEVMEGSKSKAGIFIIQSDEFGQKGKVLAELPLSSSPEAIRRELDQANKKYAAFETRKHYGKHVEKGRRTGVKYEDAMPWGEDRDADGKIDKRRGRR